MTGAAKLIEPIRRHLMFNPVSMSQLIGAPFSTDGIACPVAPEHRPVQAVAGLYGGAENTLITSAVAWKMSSWFHPYRVHDVRFQG
jgi:hypothetical protein